MLKPNFNCVGIAAYKMNGITVWAQAFGTRWKNKLFHLHFFYITNLIIFLYLLF
jgi:hypothetical protein